MKKSNKYGRISRTFRSPETTLIGSFAGVILLGAVILRLPFSHQTDRVSFVDALFTATSALCVTGLTVVDTAKDYNFLGQLVILFLIQAGGLGIMTFAALAFQLAGRRMSIQSQAIVSDTLFQRDVAAEFRRAFFTILILTFAIEGLGALLLLTLFLPLMEPGAAVFFALFHSVSAFCNAGFSVHSDNLVAFRDHLGILIIIMVLIVLGGLGYTVLHEIWMRIEDRVRWKRITGISTFSLHARLVMLVTLPLIVGGTLFLLLFGLTDAEVTWCDRIIHALFQSITARTAGFNSLDIGRLPHASLLTLIILMFIGGSPASCAGGIKTTSLAVWLARLRSIFQGKKEIHLLDRRLSEDLVNRVDLLLALAVLWNLAGFMVLCATEAQLPAQALDLLFEQISAFGTVGLSTGISPDLSDLGKLWISATMFVGRLGPLTIAFWIFPRSRVHVSYPKGRVMIG